MKKVSAFSWLFVCYIQSERRFTVNAVAVQSFFQALTEHKAVFPAHNVIFSVQTPLHLAECVGKQLQGCFNEPEKIYAEFAQRINVPVQSFVVSQVKTYQGLVPLTYNDVSARYGLSAWNGDYYESAQAFVLHPSLIEFFNSIFFVTSDNVLNMFKL